MNLSNSIYFLLFILLFAACEEPIELEIPEEAQQLSVVGIFSTFQPFQEEEPAFEIALQKSHLVTSNNDFEYVKDAQVQLFQENKLLEILSYNEDRSKYLSVSKPESGTEYTLLIEHPDHETITARTKVPSEAVIKSTTPRNITGSPNPAYKNIQDFRFTIDIELEDLEEEENFYQFLFYNQEVNISISGEQDTTFQATNRYDIVAFDVNQENEEKAVIINKGNNFYGSYLKDEQFNGQNKIVQFSLIVPLRLNQIAEQILVEVRTIPKEYYDFYLTAFQSSEAGFNPYAASPVSIKGNVKNANGIFAGYSSTIKSVRLQ